MSTDSRYSYRIEPGDEFRRSEGYIDGPLLDSEFSDGTLLSFEMCNGEGPEAEERMVAALIDAANVGLEAPSSSHSAMAAELADERQRSGQLRAALQQIEQDARFAPAGAGWQTAALEKIAALASAALAGEDGAEPVICGECGRRIGSCMVCSPREGRNV